MSKGIDMQYTDQEKRAYRLLMVANEFLKRRGFNRSGRKRRRKGGK